MLSDAELYKAAEAIIRSHAGDVEFLSISEYVADNYELPEGEHDAVCKAVDALISDAYVAVAWEES